jgi:hypothetical protein
VISPIAHNLFWHRSVCDATFLFIARNRKVGAGERPRPSLISALSRSALCQFGEDRDSQAFGCAAVIELSLVPLSRIRSSVTFSAKCWAVARA